MLKSKKVRGFIVKLLALCMISATCLFASPLSVFAAHQFTSADAKTALDVFNATYYKPETATWRNSETDGGDTHMWMSAFYNEAINFANREFPGAYRQQIIDSYYGMENVYKTNNYGNPYFWGANLWNDDILWWISAAISSYEQTGDIHMLEQAKWHMNWLIKTEIDNVNGSYGMWHDWHQRDYKDISTTGQVPTICIRLAKYYPNDLIRNDPMNISLSYKDWAKNTYNWCKSFIQADGSILNGQGSSYWDNCHFVMNVALLDASAGYLYKDTGNSSYINDAVKVTDWAKNRFTIDYNGKKIVHHEWMYSNGSYSQWVPSDNENQAIAKGILGMGVLQFTEMTGDTRYMQWMEDNAQTAWNNRRLSNDLLYGKWEVPNNTNTSSSSRGNITAILMMNYLNLLRPNSVTDRVGNSGFEANGATQNPSSWGKYNFGNSANDAASYTESKASPHNAHNGNYMLTHWMATPYQIYTSQTLTGLPNGTYAMKAYVRSSGGQNAAYIAAKDYGGGSELTANIPAVSASAWTLVTVPNINVTNGQCTIGIYSNGNAGNWINVDDVQFVSTPYVKNSSFETDIAATQNPGSWGKYNFGNSANDAASYTESKASPYNAHSGSYMLTHYKSSAYQIYTSQTLTGLPNGMYTMKAWVRSSGGQTACYMAAKDYGGGSELTASLTSVPGSGWTQVTIPNINVTNGQCTIGFYSNAPAGKWINVDDVEFVKQ